jgi:hypothetical protein
MPQQQDAVSESESEQKTSKPKPKPRITELGVAPIDPRPPSTPRR